MAYGTLPNIANAGHEPTPNVRAEQITRNLLKLPRGYFTMIVQPPLAPPKEQISPKEMVFVIDQTGSQSGWPIAKAKETMQYAIAHMNPGDTFQLIGFNTSIYPCFPAPEPIAMTAPPPRALIPGSTARQGRKTPVRFVASVAFQSASEYSSTGP